MATSQESVDTRANWRSTNRVPLANEVCYESDTGRRKLGDGSSTYIALPYSSAPLGMPSYATPAGPYNVYDTLHGAYNWKSTNTRRGDQGLSNAAKGGMTRELWIGDSASAGCINNVTTIQFDRLNAVPLAMRDQLSNWGIPGNGTGFVRIYDAGLPTDPRFGGGAGWSGQSNTYSFTSTATSFFTFTADRPGSVLDVWYNNTFTGTFSISVDGATSGTGFASVVGAGTSGWVKRRLTGLSIVNGSVIKVTLTTAGTGVGISGLSIWSPNNGLIVDNVSQSGSKIASGTTANWTDTGAASPLQVFTNVSGRTRQVTDGSATAGSPLFNSTAAVFTDNDIMEPVDFVATASGVLFPPGSYIISRQSATQVTMNVNANITASTQTANISRDPSAVHIELGGNDIQAGTAMSTIKAAFVSLAANFPNSDIYLHLIEEISPTLYTGSEQTDFQRSMFELADSMDVPLYDWRDRTGPYTSSVANSVYGDFQAHLNKASYANLGAAFAMLRNGGSGAPRVYTVPVDDGDVVNKKFIDDKLRVTTVANNATVTTTTETVVASVPIPANRFRVGSVVRYSMFMHPAATTVTTVRVHIGPLGTTADPSLIIMSASTATSTASRFAEGISAITAIGTSATHVGGGNEVINAATIGVGAATGATSSFDSTKNNFVTLTVQNGTSTTTTVYAGSLEVNI